MKQGIYHYSPTLEFKLGQIGKAFVNLCTTNPSLYVDEPLYESKSNNGLNLHLYVRDMQYEYNEEATTFYYRFSYDERLSFTNQNTIELSKADGTKEIFSRNSSTQTFDNTENKSYIKETYNEETCTNVYTLFDESERELQFDNLIGTVYFLTEIKMKNGKKITISRLNVSTLKTIKNELSRERIEFTYYDSTYTMTVYRDISQSSSEILYQFSVVLETSFAGLSVYHRVYTSGNSYRGYKSHSYVFTDELITLSESREYITLNYSFTKSTTKAITRFKDDNNNCTFIEYGTNCATVTNNRNDDRIKYVWDSTGRLTHKYDLKSQSFENTSYDNYHHKVVKSAPLYMNKELNPNYIGQGKEIDYQGKINDLVSVVLDVTSDSKYKFKANIVFKKLDDEGNVTEEDRLCPYDYHMINDSSTNSFVFSTFANIDFNHISIEVEDLTGTGTSIAYVYNAGFTENLLYKEKLLIGSLKYGELSGITRTYERIKDTPSGSFEFDDNNRLIKSIDINDNVTEFEYDDKWNTKTVKVSKNSYLTSKAYSFDDNNTQCAEADDSQNDLVIKKTLNNKGLLTKTETLKGLTHIETISDEYAQSTIPFVSKRTIEYSDDSVESINYQYLNHKLNKATFDASSYEFNSNTRPYDELSNAKINSDIFVQYIYKTFAKSGISVTSELVSSKVYANGQYYFEYDEKERLTSIKYSANKTETDAVTINTFTYETINNKDVLKSISLYNSTTQETYVTEYKYDKYGNFIGKKENNKVEQYNGFSNESTKIEQLKSRCLFTKKDVQQKIYKMKFNQKIRSLEEDIKLCAFDQKFTDPEDESKDVYSVLFNNVIDDKIDEESINYCSLYESNDNKFYINKKLSYKDLTYIKIDSLRDTENGVYGNIICFTGDPSKLIDSLNQTVSFMFSNTPVNNTSSILMCLKDFTDNISDEELLSNHNDLYLILENKDNLSKIKVCKYSAISNGKVVLTELSSLTTALNTVIPEDETKLWHFVSITYTPNKLSLFVDGTLKEMALSTIHPNRNINMIYFGNLFGDVFEGLSFDTFASFDLTNIMVPYKKVLSNDRIKDIYNMFETRNEYVSNDLLDANNNDKSNTTFHTITQNIFSDNIEYISFSKTLSSLHGLKPKVDRTLTSLSDTILDKFMFDEETLNYAYKLCGQPLEYELESSKYKDSFGVSFMLNVNPDDVGQHNIMKFLSEELSFAIAYIDGKLVFETTGSNPKELDINRNQWVLITLEMGKTIDNCSNQVYEYTFDLYINGNWRHRNKVQLDTEFEGFDELVFDFNDTHNCFNETPCLIKDMIITDSDFTSTQMNNMLKMNNKSYINTQFDSLGLKTKEVVCELGDHLIETTFGYDTNTRFKDELIKLPEDTSNSRKYTYVFDDYGRVTEQKTLKQLSTDVFDSVYNRLRYNYDAKGQLITDIINHNELPSGIAHQYTYDKYGNIESYKVNGNTVHTFTYDEYNRMITFDNKTVTYNDNDGMISLTPSTIGDDTYSWQGRRLMSISGTKNIQFEYNEQGLRTFKRVDTGQTLNSNKIYKDYEYVYDLDNKLICQRVTYLNSIDTMIFLYHDDHLYGFEYAQSKYFYLRDSLGNIIGIIDSTGKIVVEYVYNAFGKIIDILGEMKDTIGVNNPMRYKGYYYDCETQMYYCKSRYYNSDFCRWISGDSEKYIDTETPLGLNLFIYCNNDPANKYDPTVHIAFWAIVLLALAVVSTIATANDIYQIARGEDDGEGLIVSVSGDNVHIENSYKILTPWMRYGYSLYLNYYNTDTKDVIQGSTAGLAFEWGIHNLAAWFGIAEERTKHLDVGKTIFSDGEEHPLFDKQGKINGPGVMSFIMRVGYIMSSSPIFWIYDLIVNGGN